MDVPDLAVDRAAMVAPYDRHSVAEVCCVVWGDRCRAASGARAVAGPALRVRLPSDELGAVAVLSGPENAQLRGYGDGPLAGH